MSTETVNRCGICAQPIMPSQIETREDGSFVHESCIRVRTSANAIALILAGSEYTDGEKRLLEWQLGRASGFVKSLFDTIARADEQNRALLARGFGQEVAAMYRWHNGTLADDWRKIGVLLG